MDEVLVVVMLEGDVETVLAEFTGLDAHAEAEYLRDAMQDVADKRVPWVRYAKRWRPAATQRRKVGGGRWPLAS